MLLAFTPPDKGTICLVLVVVYVLVQLWWWGFKWHVARQEKRQRPFR
jgi:hypothetical protein